MLDKTGQNQQKNDMKKDVFRVWNVKNQTKSGHNKCTIGVAQAAVVKRLKKEKFDTTDILAVKVPSRVSQGTAILYRTRDWQNVIKKDIFPWTYGVDYYQNPWTELYFFTIFAWFLWSSFFHEFLS